VTREVSIIASALINWRDLWKIIVAALVGGGGVVIVFGLLLLGISRGKTATRPIARYGLYTVSGLCALLVVGVAAVGIYAMTRKPSPPKPKLKATPSRALPPRPGPRLAARDVSTTGALVFTPLRPVEGLGTLRAEARWIRSALEQSLTRITATSVTGPGRSSSRTSSGSLPPYRSTPGS
jgi:hypothetical protein